MHKYPGARPRPAARWRQQLARSARRHCGASQPIGSDLPSKPRRGNPVLEQIVSALRQINIWPSPAANGNSAYNPPNARAPSNSRRLPAGWRFDGCPRLAHEPWHAPCRPIFNRGFCISLPGAGATPPAIISSRRRCCSRSLRIRHPGYQRSRVLLRRRSRKFRLFALRSAEAAGIAQVPDVVQPDSGDRVSLSPNPGPNHAVSCHSGLGGSERRASLHRQKNAAPPRERRVMLFPISSVAAGRAAHLHRGVIRIARRDHLDALARGVLRRDPLVLDARRRNHHGLRHHHGAVLRRRAVRDHGARRHHHGLVDGAVLRRHVLLLIAGLARRRCVAIVAAGGGRTRHGNRRNDR